MLRWQMLGLGFYYFFLHFSVKLNYLKKEKKVKHVVKKVLY